MIKQEMAQLKDAVRTGYVAATRKTAEKIILKAAEKIVRGKKQEEKHKRV